jgi:uncharacterized membrane protein YeaQ/YmgE (transglycosylase-associated protein family)
MAGRRKSDFRKRRKTMDFIWFLLIGAISGWLAGKFIKGKGFGVIGNIIVGCIGAFLGGFLFGLVGLQSTGGLIASLFTAFVGAVILLFIVGKIKKA